MKYCLQCGSEYEESVKECSDCGGAEFGGTDELKSRGIPLPGERDTRKFVRAGTTEDPLSSEQLVRVLEELEIPVFARPRRGGTVDSLTSGASPWWEILVPEEHVVRASEVIAQERARMESGAEDAARAAEEEEAETEAAAKT